MVGVQNTAGTAGTAATVGDLNSSSNTLPDILETGEPLYRIGGAIPKVLTQTNSVRKLTNAQDSMRQLVRSNSNLP